MRTPTTLSLRFEPTLTQFTDLDLHSAEEFFVEEDFGPL